MLKYTCSSHVLFICYDVYVNDATATAYYAHDRTNSKQQILNYLCLLVTGECLSVVFVDPHYIMLNFNEARPWTVGQLALKRP